MGSVEKHDPEHQVRQYEARNLWSNWLKPKQEIIDRDSIGVKIVKSETETWLELTAVYDFLCWISVLFYLTDSHYLITNKTKFRLYIFTAQGLKSLWFITSS